MAIDLSTVATDIVPKVVTIASFFSALFPVSRFSGFWAKLKSFIDILALNVGNAGSHTPTDLKANPVSTTPVA